MQEGRANILHSAWWESHVESGVGGAEARREAGECDGRKASRWVAAVPRLAWHRSAFVPERQQRREGKRPPQPGASPCRRQRPLRGRKAPRLSLQAPPKEAPRSGPRHFPGRATGASSAPEEAALGGQAALFSPPPSPPRPLRASSPRQAAATSAGRRLLALTYLDVAGEIDPQHCP